MSDQFEITGSTVEHSSDDLLRELCGDEPGTAIVQDEIDDAELDAEETEEHPTLDKEAEVHPEESTQEEISSGIESFDEYLQAHTGRFFVFHMDTYPDESRHPRPATMQRERQEVDLAELIKGNADKIKISLRSGVMFEDQLEELRELEMNTKVRDTVLKEIDRALNCMDGEFDKWKKEGMTDPWKGRIVSFAWSFLGEDQVHTMVAPPGHDPDGKPEYGTSDDLEREILATFWALQSVGIRVGYGIDNEEDTWIVARSMILDVQASTGLDRSRYGNKQAVDIMTRLFTGGHNAISAKSLAHMIRINVPDVCTVAVDVFGMVEAMDWESVAQWSSGTVAMEKGLFTSLKRYVRV